MNPVVHFELPGEDMERMKAFYERAFGWKMQQMGAEMGNYVVAWTGETDADGMIKKPGMINGGFYKKTKEAQHPSIVVAVDDIRAAMKAVEEAGGKALGGMTPGEPDNIPGVGLFSGMIDTEGNMIAMLQPTKPMQS